MAEVSARGGAAAAAAFVAASAFQGRRLGYAFKMGPRGLGYYVDVVQGAVLDDASHAQEGGSVNVLRTGADSRAESSETAVGGESPTNEPDYGAEIDPADYEPMQVERDPATKELEERIKSDEALTDRERRFLRLRLSLNQARRENHAEVLREGRRINDPKYKQRQRMADRAERENDWKREVSMKGIQGSELDSLISVEVSERLGSQRRRKRQRAVAFGWDYYNQDRRLQSHDKRIAAARRADRRKRTASGRGSVAGAAATSAASEVTTPVAGASVLAAEPTLGAKERMAAELASHQERVSQFSKRRAHDDDKDVDYINPRNQAFSDRISRAYDKYTVEIRQSLERGTA